MKNAIEWILIGISAFVLLGSMLSAKRLRKSLDTIVVWLPIAILVVHTLLRSVDRFAGWWGPHEGWKLPIAALILAVFPFFAWQYQRLSTNKLERRTGIGIALAVWAFAVGIVIIGWIQFPHPLEVLPENLQGLDWVPIHLTPAIHHLYANATYLGFYVAAMIILLWGRPFSSRLCGWLGSTRIVNGASGLILLGSVISKVAFRS